MKWFVPLLFLAACSKTPPEVTTVPAAPSSGLRSVEALSKIEDDEARARAAFAEVTKVLMHPRCVNCHPAADRPMQGAGLPHHPLVVRGADGHGVPGLECESCHGAASFENVPGAPNWHLAPASMAWAGKTPAEICAQLVDDALNGGLDHAGLLKHVAEDSLVAYGWNPPAHLEPAPGDQAAFAALFGVWLDAGAHCP